MKKTTFLIVGRHAVTEVIKNPKRKIHRLFVTEDSFKRLKKENQSINFSKKAHIFYKTKKELNNLCSKDEVPHQGIIAEIENLENENLKTFLSDNIEKNLNFLALDEITDPRNIGSIIRSAVSFNIDGILVIERSFPSESKVLYKSASGGVEHVKIFKVSNLNTALRFLKTKGFWVSAFDSSSKKNFTENNWKGRNVLLFGSEGSGLRKNTITNSDFQFRIKINSNIESLNVANAVSIVCHFINYKNNG